MEGRLADIAHNLVVEALIRAARAPEGLPLYEGKAGDGLFAATSAGKQAALRCRTNGFLQIARDPADREVAVLTDKGLGYLVEHADPAPLVRAVVESLDRRSQSLATVRQEIERTQQQTEGVRAALAKWTAKSASAERIDPLALTERLREKLRHWRQSGLLGDCPLPDLFRHLRQSQPTLSIGQFHDHLRHLHQHQEIYLHPWTGPLYQLPEPALALLIGHEIAYYANLRG
jgi:hypothetical protein